MADQYIAFSIPVFLIFIALETAYSMRKNRHLLRINDSISSISCGIITLIFEMFTKGALFLLFDAIYRDYSLMQWSVSDGFAWVLFFFVYDFLYYWAHRLDHSINFFWNGHLPHHQSEEYNLTTALRQGALQDTLNFPVFIPMAIMGCPVEIFATTIVMSKLYQFWIHTRAIGRVPAIEGILNTPSAHRVHHAVNRIYVDKNLGGFLMVWDKLFGTWSDEKASEHCVYGVRKPYRSWNPLLAHIDWWARLWKDATNTQRTADKLKLWFMPTGWRPADVEASDPWGEYDIEQYKKYDPVVSRVRTLSSIVILTLTLPLLSYLLFEQFNLPLQEKAGIAALILFCLYLSGHWLTNNKQSADHTDRLTK